MREQHPTWHYPAKRLHLFPQFEDAAVLRSPEWYGREQEWVAALTRFSTVLSYIMQGNEGRILDVAAGDGLYTALLAWGNTQTDPPYWRILAGVSSEEQAQQVAERVRQEGGSNYVDAIRVLDPAIMATLTDESFDLVYVFGPLFEILDADTWQRVVKEAYRVLKPSGHLIASVKTQRAAAARAVLDPEGWQTEDDLNHLTIFADPNFYGPIELPPGLPPYYYMLGEDIAPTFEARGFSTVEVLPVGALTSWIPASLWPKIIDAGPSAIDILLTLEGTVAEDPAMAGMATEVLYVGRKP